MTDTVSPPSAPCGLRSHVAAWLVHSFTLTGFLWAALAVAALLRDNPHLMWLWLGMAMMVDGVDGNLARRFRVKEVVPWFNGAVVDNVVDYLTWTAIPTLFMVQYLPLGPPNVAFALALLVLVSSMFCYANEAAKSTDYYFVGFPAAWNIIAVLLWVWEARTFVCVIVILVFSVMTVVPLHYTHPFRVQRGRSLNIAATIVWVGSTAVLIMAMPPLPYDLGPVTNSVVVTVNVLSGLWLIVGGLRRSFSGS